MVKLEVYILKMFSLWVCAKEKDNYTHWSRQLLCFYYLYLSVKEQDNVISRIKVIYLSVYNIGFSNGMKVSHPFMHVQHIHRRLHSE